MDDALQLARNKYLHFSFKPHSRFDWNETTLLEEDREMIYKYLENPTEVGIWFLDLEWITSAEITEDIINMLKNPDKSIQKNKQKNGLPKTYRGDEIKNFSKIVQKRSFIFLLFLFLTIKEDKKGDKFLEILRRGNEKEYYLILNSINLNKIKRKYHEAFEYFKNELYFKNFNPIVKESKAIKLKEGFYLDFNILESREEYFAETDLERVSSLFMSQNEAIEQKYKFRIISLSKDPLVKLLQFYQMISKVKDTNVVRYFSPEEEVFAPYVFFLDLVSETITPDKTLKIKLKRAIEQYKNEEYEYCVSSVGLVSEEILVRIYETLFRQVCPKVPLGEIYSQIQKKINEAMKGPPKYQAPDINPLHKKMEEIFKLEEKATKKEILQMLRSMLVFIQENSKFTFHTIEESQKEKSEYSIFPTEINRNIFELKEYRDAVSHRSSVNIKSYEALRSLYCCVTLMRWWSSEHKSINWDETKENIQVGLVIKNSQI